eukprot:1399473-Pleurochrysis_carterae.AAC.1
MSSDDAASHMHRRLHVGHARLRDLPSLTSDAPASLAKAASSTCGACAEANATRLPHGSDLYTPSHPGRLVHVDIAGPFVPSQDGGKRYALVM